ncbi:MAG TPA: hypothetical protein VH325_08120 [Bryobacteraceae bacterium]|nr:hypothetical protein [Bryobacteraceae bacterium]
MARLLGVVGLAAGSVAWAQTPVWTYHNDLARTGLNPYETVLTPANVRSSFSKNFSVTVDGQVYAQPLYVPDLPIPGKGIHNVVFVATEHDSVYAFDADSNAGVNAAPLWQVSLLLPGATTIMAELTDCGQITPEIGITATPVIDRSARTIYVVASAMEGNTTVHRLHALNLETGAELRPSVVIAGTAVNSAGQSVSFDSTFHKARPGLLLLDGIVYTSWGSHCDRPPYYGWLIGYNGSTFAQTLVVNLAPDKGGAALWNSGAAPASDGRLLYFETANGDFDADGPGNLDYSNSFVKYDPVAQQVTGYYTPPNQATLSAGDLDVGSGGLLLLPDSAGSAIHPHLMVGASKNGTVYLVDRDDPGGYDTGAAPVQSSNAIASSFGMPAYFNGAIYFGGNGDALKRFSMGGGGYSPTATSVSTEVYGFPGATPSISSNGNADGIVWAIENKSGQAILHAYDANDLSQELYNSGALASDAAGGYVKFTVPTIADGKVFVGGAGTLSVYTLAAAGCAQDVTNSVSVTSRRAWPASNSNLTIQNTSETDLAGPISIAVTGLPAGFSLAQAAGTGTCPGIAGAPYLNLPAGLAAGQTATISLDLSGPSRMPAIFGYRVLAGSGTR